MGKVTEVTIFLHWRRRLSKNGAHASVMPIALDLTAWMILPRLLHSTATQEPQDGRQTSKASWLGTLSLTCHIVTTACMAPSPVTICFQSLNGTVTSKLAAGRMIHPIHVLLSCRNSTL